MKKILKWGLGSVGLVIVVLALMIAFGSSAPPPPMRSVMDVVAAVDRSDMPPVSHFPARDGVQLAYRAYPASPAKIAILIHGSSGSSAGMHAMGKALSKAGITAFALDVRGHGESGVKGDIRYIGQLEDDLADFIAYLRKTYPKAPITLIGHSSGGGFVLRVAGSPINRLFSRYILTAPFLRYDAPTMRGMNSGGWVKPFIPRIIAIGILNSIGIDWFSGLPVIAFAIPADAWGTRTYSYRLSANFVPHSDYLADFRRSNAAITILVGKNDEIFIADKYETALAPVKQYVRIEVIPGMGHMAMVSNPIALTALIKTCSIEQ
ncbi:MAG: alpha/beta hydrolase [Deltaproteobacteria bacterium]|nr:alpha/beta hydrolase [Deltaproteobacteria bacterium]